MLNIWEVAHLIGKALILKIDIKRVMLTIELLMAKE